MTAPCSSQRGDSNFSECERRQSLVSAPYVKIDPQDMRIDFPVPTVAVVTFHLTNPTRTSPRGPIVGRRMFVVAKTASGWKITHMNNSDVAARQ
jgi:hypothetical protein